MNRPAIFCIPICDLAQCVASDSRNCTWASLLIPGDSNRCLLYVCSSMNAIAMICFHCSGEFLKFLQGFKQVPSKMSSSLFLKTFVGTQNNFAWFWHANRKRLLNPGLGYCNCFDLAEIKLQTCTWKVNVGKFLVVYACHNHYQGGHAMSHWLPKVSPHARAVIALIVWVSVSTERTVINYHAFSFTVNCISCVTK